MDPNGTDRRTEEKLHSVIRPVKGGQYDKKYQQNIKYEVSPYKDYCMMKNDGGPPKTAMYVQGETWSS